MWHLIKHGHWSHWTPWRPVFGLSQDGRLWDRRYCQQCGRQQFRRY